jgi:peptide-methionine (S)-S-oxide reductase
MTWRPKVTERTSTRWRISNDRRTCRSGCFWGLQDLIRRYDGVISTRVGYSGCDVPNATYRNHGTTLKPLRLSSIPPRSAIVGFLSFSSRFTTIPRVIVRAMTWGRAIDRRSSTRATKQKRIAEDTIADVEASGLWPGEVVTEVSPAGPFWEAEPEHQDYLEKNPNGYTCHFIRPDWKLPARKDADRVESSAAEG